MAALDASQIQAAPAAPDAASAAAPAAPQGQSAIPQTSDPFLQGVYSNPVIQQLAAGKIPAVYAPASIFGDHAPQVVPKLAQGLAAINLQMLQAPKSNVLVVFNPKIVHPNVILHADNSGELGKIASPLQTGGAPAQAPSPNSAPPQAPAASATPAPQQTSAPAQITQDLFKAPDARGPIADQRNRNLTPQPPVGQPLPSQGILNGLFKRAS